MRITKRQLRRIIREASSGVSEEPHATKPWEPEYRHTEKAWNSGVIQSAADIPALADLMNSASLKPTQWKPVDWFYKQGPAFELRSAEGRFTISWRKDDRGWWVEGKGELGRMRKVEYVYQALSPALGDDLKKLAVDTAALSDFVRGMVG